MSNVWTEERVEKRLRIFGLYTLSAAFLLVAGFFFLTEHLRWSVSAAAGAIGLAMFVVAAILQSRYLREEMR